MGDFHHYKKSLLNPKTDRVAIYERHIADLLLQNPIPDDRHDSSLLFELKHSHGAIQFARVLARIRGLNEDVCAVAMLLHDISVGLTGSYRDHARKSADLAKDIMNELGLFTKQEQNQVLTIIANHSDKHIISNDPYHEIGKDADIVDCFLYPGAVDGYRFQKSPEAFGIYIARAGRIFAELGIPFKGEQ